MSQIVEFLLSEDGASAIEYAIVAGFLSIVILASVDDIGGRVLEKFESVAGSFP